MKPFFLKKKSLWYSILIIGVIFVMIGFFQMSMSIGKTGQGGGPLSPVSNEGKSQVDGNETGKLKARENESAINPGENERKPEKGRVVGEARPNEFFVEYRLERERTRSQQVDLLREIINNQNSSESAKKEAQSRMLAISQSIETEMKLENLIRAENFKDSVVFVQDKSVTVIVQIPMLTAMDRQKINSITTRITGLDEQNVVIIPKV